MNQQADLMKQMHNSYIISSYAFKQGVTCHLSIYSDINMQEFQRNGLQ